MCDVVRAVSTANSSNLSHISRNDCAKQENILETFLPLIILFGTIGNFLCLFVFRRPTFRTMSVAFYLYVYAIVNLLNLYLSYGMTWFSMISGVTHFENYTDWGCRIWQFLYRIVAYSGIWLLVSALIDRYIALCFPNTAGRFCRVFMAKITVVIVFIGISVISVHAMWSYEIRQDMCVPIETDLHSMIWSWMSASCNVFIPLLTMLSFKIAILLEFCLKRRTGNVTKQFGVPSNLTYTVIVLAGTYLLLAVPATIVNIMDFQEENSIYNFEKIRFISNLLSCFNPAIMFFTCVLMSRSFRVELVKGFQELCCQKETSNLRTTELTDEYEGFVRVMSQNSEETRL